MDDLQQVEKSDLIVQSKKNFAQKDDAHDKT